LQIQLLLQRLVMVQIEEVPVQILYGELPQPPRLFFQRPHDVRTWRLQFLMRRIDIFSEHPVNPEFERRLPLAKEYRHIPA
jgi:hypothetical protein